jgi:type IV secretion system protein TrbI
MILQSRTANHRSWPFINGRIDQTIYSPQRLQLPRSPYQLMAGSVISAGLMTGPNSDLPGPIVAQVTEDVYDTVSGRFLLIPQAARLIGKYDSHIAYGQERLLLIWMRLVMPDGSSIVLDNLPAKRYGGLRRARGRRRLPYLAAAERRGTLFIARDLERTGCQQCTQSNNRIIIGLRDSVNNTANEEGQRIVSKDLAVQPTLTVRPGYPVRVIVNRDIVLRPYGNR